MVAKFYLIVLASLVGLLPLIPNRPFNTNYRCHFQRSEKQDHHKRKSKREPESLDEKAALKEQAVQLLKYVLEESYSIDDVEQRAYVISEAAELLWKYDKEYARSGLSKAVENLLHRYAAEVRSLHREKATTNKLQLALNHLLRTIARKDPVWADSEMKRYLKIKEEELESYAHSSQTLNDKLSLARESLDLDTKQSAAMAARILETGVAPSFPQYLYDLAKRDTSTADALYRKAILILTTTKVYRPSEAILLSIYPFKERVKIIPTSAPVNNGRKGVGLGIQAFPLSPSEGNWNPALTGEYLTSAYAFLTSIHLSDSSRSLDPVQLAQSFFLVKKLRIYAANYMPGSLEKWDGLESKIRALSQQANFEPPVLDYLAGYAERLATAQRLFLSEDEASLFQMAKVTKNPHEQTELIVRGVMVLLDKRKFEEAEHKLEEISDKIVRDHIADYTNFRAGQFAVEKRKWDEITRRSSQIIAAQARLYLLLEGARAAVNSNKQDKAIEYLEDALGIASKVDGNADMAKGLTAVAALSSPLDPVRGREILNSAVKAVNNAPDYYDEDFQTVFEIYGANKIAFLFDSTHLTICFEHIAKTDWIDALYLSQSLKSNNLRLKAQVAVCRALL